MLSVVTGIGATVGRTWPKVTPRHRPAASVASRRTITTALFAQLGICMREIAKNVLPACDSEIGRETLLLLQKPPGVLAPQNIVEHQVRRAWYLATPGS